MTSPAASRARASGYTLVELLVVLAIGLIVLGFALPTTFSVYRRQLVDDAARDLVDTLRRARAQAVANINGQPHGVKVMTVSSTFVLFSGDSYALRDTSKDEEIVYAETVSFNATSSEVVFSQIYGTSTVDETWTLENVELSKPVRIGPHGAIGLE